MKTKPILFSTEMIHANSAGVKTQTRRVINEIHYGFLEYAFKNKKNLADWISKNAKYQMGDILWVRETFQETYMIKSNIKSFLYKADFTGVDQKIIKWSPSIHMPKVAARRFLKILSVRVERLQEISNSDAIAEGILSLTMSNAQLIEMGQLYFDYSKPAEIMNDGLYPISSFKTLWEKINGKKIPWIKNPFVFVYEYEIIKRPQNFI